MSIANRLDDHQSGWSRHPEDTGIVFVDHRDIFLTAVRDASCRAIVWTQTSEKIQKDRTALKRLWNKLDMRKAKPFDRALYEIGYHTEHGIIRNTIPFDYGDEQILELAKLHCQATHLGAASVTLLPNFRESRAEGKDHQPHGFEVTNRVLFGKGTHLRMNVGTYQVGEGHILHMKPMTGHHPDFETEDGKYEARLTLVAK